MGPTSSYYSPLSKSPGYENLLPSLKFKTRKVLCRWWWEVGSPSLVWTFKHEERRIGTHLTGNELKTVNDVNTTVYQSVKVKTGIRIRLRDPQ